jgi:POT family proton-dependent oligopeptide transporter
VFSLPFNTQQRQTAYIILITFWSQFSSYALNSIFILFLTKPFLEHGLQYDQATAYAFIGVSAANRYLMTIIGGYMADTVLGLRRSILLGSLLLALAYLFVMLSGFTLDMSSDYYFLAAYALVPGAESLLIGTTSGMVSRIYHANVSEAKSAMTYYYLAINVGALLAICIAPELLNSRYGALSVLALSFIGKSIAALNFAQHYALYNNVTSPLDRSPLTHQRYRQIGIYFIAVYAFTFYAYTHLQTASVIISVGCLIGISWFFIKTQQLTATARNKQLVALLLIIEAIVFFVIYNQMNSTLILLAQFNSDCRLFGMTISPAQYQLLNPLLIILFGLQLPLVYKRFPRFSIPYQFALGTLLASAGLLILALGAYFNHQGLINGNVIALCYILISLAELLVSAIGLSMIGLYCDNRNLAFAMGMWYLGGSLSNTIAAFIARWVAIPANMTSPLQRLAIYQQYYWILGSIAMVLSLVMFAIARQSRLKRIIQHAEP